MTYVGGMIIAILFTALSYFLSDRTLYKRLHFWQPLMIGLVVVIAGALADLLHAPMWLIIIIPFVLGVGLLWSFLRMRKVLIYTYVLTWVYYSVFHIILSSVFKFDSLIPAWKLHS